MGGESSERLTFSPAMDDEELPLLPEARDSTAPERVEAVQQPQVAPGAANVAVSRQRRQCPAPLVYLGHIRLAPPDAE